MKKFVNESLTSYKTSCLRKNIIETDIRLQTGLTYDHNSRRPFHIIHHDIKREESIFEHSID